MRHPHNEGMKMACLPVIHGQALRGVLAHSW